MNISRYKRLLQLTHTLQKNLYDSKLKHYSAKVIGSGEAISKIQPRDLYKESSKSNRKTRKYKERLTIPYSYNTAVNNEQNVKRQSQCNNKQEYPEDFYLNKLSNYNKSVEDENEKLKMTDILSSEENNFLYSKSNDYDNVALDNEIVETNEESITLLPSNKFYSDEFLDDELDKIIPHPLDECTEDISDFGPGLAPTFNFAAYADKSKLIQTYVKLGVKLYKIESNPDHMKALLTVDLNNELPVYLQFLNDCGVSPDNLGYVITLNPMLLKEDLDHMKTRIRYLRAHDFTKENIARIVVKNPSWLTWTTKSIDERLGHFQTEFTLSGPEVRYLTTSQPKLITHNMDVIHENTFAVREEMGFNRHETKALLLRKPTIWKMSREKTVDSFDYLQNVMNLSNQMIIANAETLTVRKRRLKNRHEFLLKLNKVQYDPTQPGYISPLDVSMGSDEQFCKNVAKASVQTYNLFLKTL